MKTHSEILQAVRLLVAEPDRYCRQCFAQDEHGKVTTSCDPKARRVSILGALLRVTGVNARGLMGPPVEYVPTGGPEPFRSLVQLLDKSVQATTPYHSLVYMEARQVAHSRALRALDHAIDNLNATLSPRP